uniref:Uncharacterized protein n=1 Tax=Arundo donax TaxID=35708 RepID=A0A0A9HDJ2_ARUDO
MQNPLPQAPLMINFAHNILVDSVSLETIPLFFSNAQESCVSSH